MVAQSYPQLTELEVDHALEKHAEWIASDGKRGEQAVFTHRQIYNYNFAKKKLYKVNFYDSKLLGCKFISATLTDVSFRGAELYECDFSEANMHLTDFSHAALRGCTLQDAKCLTLRGFARASLDASILPESMSFEKMIEHTNELVKKSRNILSAYLVVNLYALLIILENDRENSHEFNIRWFSSDIHITSLSLQIAIPILLVVLGLVASFFSLSLSGLDKQLKKIPAVFPDGRCAHETIFPWFWLTWSLEIEQWIKEVKHWTFHERHLTALRVVIIAFLCNIYFTVFFTLMLIWICKVKTIWFFFSNHSCGATALVGIVFFVSLPVAFYIRKAFYTFCAGTGAVTTIIFIYCHTNDYTYSIMTLLSMMLAWWTDLLIFRREPLLLDLSYPDSQFHMDTINKNISYYTKWNCVAQLLVGLALCSIAALLIFSKYRMVFCELV